MRGTTDTAANPAAIWAAVTGLNTVNGTITGAATGKWFVYGDNTTDESKIGGMIGMNRQPARSSGWSTAPPCLPLPAQKAIKIDDDTTHRGNKNIAYVGGVIRRAAEHGR